SFASRQRGSPPPWLGSQAYRHSRSSASSSADAPETSDPYPAIGRRHRERSGRQGNGASPHGQERLASPTRLFPAQDDPPGPVRNRASCPPNRASRRDALDRLATLARPRPAGPVYARRLQVTAPGWVQREQDERASGRLGPTFKTYFSTSTPRQKATNPLILRAAGLGSG